MCRPIESGAGVQRCRGFERPTAGVSYRTSINLSRARSFGVLPVEAPITKHVENDTHTPVCPWKQRETSMCARCFRKAIGYLCRSPRRQPLNAIPPPSCCVLSSGLHIGTSPETAHRTPVHRCSALDMRVYVVGSEGHALSPIPNRQWLARRFCLCL